MKTISEWLGSLQASDVMTGSVLCLHPSETLADAASLFLREQITGAPVVDEHGICVGILSATDILSFEEKRAEQPVAAAAHRPHCFDTWDPGSTWWREFGRIRDEIRPRLDESVVEFMTRDVVSVTEDTSLGVVIRQMVDAHVHRVLVLDSARRPQGIISTMDVLAALLRAGHPRQS
jgi:predicted transcriptional regulator